MSQQLEEIVQRALEFGISHSIIYSLTHREAIQLLQARQKAIQQQLSLNLQTNRILAYEIALMQNGKKPKPLQQLYPDLMQEVKSPNQDKINLLKWLHKEAQA